MEGFMMTIIKCNGLNKKMPYFTSCPIISTTKQASPRGAVWTVRFPSEVKLN